MNHFAKALTLAAMMAAGVAQAQTQGVSDDKIVLGTFTDLSGPLAVWGVPEQKGMRMRVEEINAEGGINGRMLELVVEDTQYQVPRAMQAANKLLRRDKVFAMVGSLGTPENLAVMPQLMEANVPSLFPMTAAVEMVEPLSPLKYAFFRSYPEQFRAATAYFHDNGGFKTPCVAQIANEAGESMAAGVHEQLEVYGMKVAAMTEHSATETDMVSSVTTLKNAGCDIVFLAGSVKDTILIVLTSRKLGFDPIFVTGMVPYMDAVAGAGEGAMDGLYLVSPFVYVDVASAEGEAKEIVEAYEAKYSEKMAPQAQLGYIFIDMVKAALEKVGPEVTVEKFTAALEGMTDYVDPIGGQHVSFGPEDHQGVETLILARVEGGKWTVAARGLDY